MSQGTLSGIFRLSAFQAAVLVVFAVLIGNVGAVVDVVLHPEIRYFDQEHLVVGGTTAFVIGVLSVLLLGHVRQLGTHAAALQEGKDRHRSIVQTAMDGFWLVDMQARLLEVNATYCRMSGYSEPELLAMHVYDLVPHETADITAAHIQRFIAQGDDRFESRHRRKDGTIFEVEVSVQYRRAGGGRLVVFLRDITERKRAEVAMQSSLREKEALLREVHHRVKNNLQVVTSLLRLEAGRSAQPDTKAVLNDMQGRIQSMALLHESLYRSGTFASVDLGVYLRRLATQSLRSLVASDGSVQLRMDMASVHVEMDQAMPCGLLVHELISNCFKHGFPAGHRGEVRVELQRVDGGPQVRLRVSDTGVGLPADFEAKRADALGLQLVSDLARQLGGTLDIGPGPGAVFTVTFTPAKPMAAA